MNAAQSVVDEKRAQLRKVVEQLVEASNRIISADPDSVARACAAEELEVAALRCTLAEMTLRQAEKLAKDLDRAGGAL